MPLKYIEFIARTKKYIFLIYLPEWSGPSEIQNSQDFGSGSNLVGVWGPFVRVDAHCSCVSCLQSKRNERIFGAVILMTIFIRSGDSIVSVAPFGLQTPIYTVVHRVS